MEKQELDRFGQTFREMFKKGKYPRTRPEWTKKIKTILWEMGHPKYAVYLKGIEKKVDWTEWVWDVVWAEQSISPYDETGEYPICRLILICESEWLLDPSNVMRDFQKLTVGIAELKLYIYRIRKPGQKKGAKRVLSSDELIRDCDDIIIPNPEQMPSAYLFIGIPTESSDKMEIKVREKRGVCRNI